MPTIEYFYSAHSAYAYLGAQKLAQMCSDYNCTLLHRPIYLSPWWKPQVRSPSALAVKPMLITSLAARLNAGLNSAARI